MYHFKLILKRKKKTYSFIKKYATHEIEMTQP